MVAHKIQEKVTRVPKGTATYEEAIRRAKVYVAKENKTLLNILNNGSYNVAVFYMGDDIYSINVNLGLSTETIYTILDKNFRIKEEPKEFKSIW